MSRRAEGALYRLLKLPRYRLQCGQQGILYDFEIEIKNTREQSSPGLHLGFSPSAKGNRWNQNTATPGLRCFWNRGNPVGRHPGYCSQLLRE